MLETAAAFSLLIADNDELMIADAGAMAQEQANVMSTRDAIEAFSLAASGDYDAVAVNLALPGGMDLVSLIANELSCPVIAMAARGLDGRTLEHTLTLAELHGAAASFAKPIDAVELAAAAIDVVSRRSQAKPGMIELRRRLEAMIAAA